MRADLRCKEQQEKVAAITIIKTCNYKAKIRPRESDVKNTIGKGSD
jgi:hypothetical protein